MCVTDKIQVVEKRDWNPSEAGYHYHADEFIQGIILLTRLVGFLTMKQSEGWVPSYWCGLEVTGTWALVGGAMGLDG